MEILTTKTPLICPHCKYETTYVDVGETIKCPDCWAVYNRTATVFRVTTRGV